MIISILLAIIATFGFAYLLVKYLPLKHKWMVSIFLLIVSVILVYKIYDGIMKPINFNQDKRVKFAKVIQNLKIIRDAELAFYQVNGKYTDSKEGLIQFIDTAQFAITETRDTVFQVNKGTRWQPVMVPVEKRILDTIGYESVLNSFEGKNYTNMFDVPGVEGKQFELVIGEVEKIPGLRVPVFEARTEKKDILKGMDASLVKQEMEAIETDQIKGEYVSVGSLSEVTTGGNWPPSYDKADRGEENDK
ncbi:MAG: Uncharacterised protein [Flavobacterium sp. SCGC AAA160-P02]|nr:MAG: Uncharacterised protein [Flavobacterium sp. SCGC AAA160-P02]